MGVIYVICDFVSVCDICDCWFCLVILCLLWLWLWFYFFCSFRLYANLINLLYCCCVWWWCGVVGVVELFKESFNDSWLWLLLWLCCGVDGVIVVLCSVVVVGLGVGVGGLLPLRLLLWLLVLLALFKSLNDSWLLLCLFRKSSLRALLPLFYLNGPRPTIYCVFGLLPTILLPPSLPY